MRAGRLRAQTGLSRLAHGSAAPSACLPPWACRGQALPEPLRAPCRCCADAVRFSRAPADAARSGGGARAHLRHQRRFACQRAHRLRRRVGASHVCALLPGADAPVHKVRFLVLPGGRDVPGPVVPAGQLLLPDNA
eukprot:1179111-Prymnesium_polylepis.2